MNATDQALVEDNHRRYLARKVLYLQHGYDIDAERAFVIDKAQPVAGNILEAGTGKGYFSLALAQRGSRFTSVDISPTEQQFARLNLGYHGLEELARVDIADGESLPYEDQRFDFVFPVNLVHHLASASKVFAELIRVLAPAGKLVVSDMNQHGLAVLDKIHALDGNLHHVGPDTLSDVHNLLQERGFKVKFHAGHHQDTLIAGREV